MSTYVHFDQPWPPLGWRALKTPTAETPVFYGHVTTLTLQYLWPRPPGVWLEGPGCKPGHSGWSWWSPAIKIASGLIPVMTVTSRVHCDQPCPPVTIVINWDQPWPLWPVVSVVTSHVHLCPLWSAVTSHDHCDQSCPLWPGFRSTPAPINTGPHHSGPHPGHTGPQPHRPPTTPAPCHTGTCLKGAMLDTC